MNGELLYGVHEGLLFAGCALLLLAAIEGGFRLGQWQRGRDPEAGKGQLSTIVGAILALLGLLLGFTFSMAATRFDTRKQNVLDEANAVGTAYLRARLLPEPEGRQMRDLLRRYVDHRIEVRAKIGKSLTLREVNQQAEQMHEQMWTRAVKAAQKDPRSVPTGLFVQSLNEVIDMHGKRITSAENHVPVSILFLLIGVGALSMALTGFASGLEGRRHLYPAVALTLLVAAVMVVIIDLDRPRTGLIHVSQKAMLRLQESLHEDSEAK